MHNMRSLNLDKFNELKLIAANHDIIAIIESWLTAEKEQLYNLDNFTLHHCHRGKKRTGGGVAVYIRNHLNVQKLCSYSNQHMSAYWFLLHHDDQPPVIYGVLYHPPGLCKQLKEETTNHIIKTIASLQSKHKSAKFLVCGDFNDLETTEITTLLPMDQIVNFATRGENMLDKIFTDVQEYIDCGCISEPPILNNDHCAVALPPVQRIRRPKYVTVKKHLVSPKSKLAIFEELNSYDWDFIHAEPNVDKKGRTSSSFYV